MKGIFWVLGCKLAFQQPLHKRKPIKWKAATRPVGTAATAASISIPVFQAGI
jgi:hypothetical protein